MKSINDNYYDARLKRHHFRGKKQTVIVFSNVSAVKQLQQERVIKDYTRIMTASNYHEFRTPIGAGLNALTLIKPSISPEQMKNLMILECSLKFLLMLADDCLDFAGIESGNFKMKCEDISLRAPLNEVV